jgi:hypothetical protein
MGRDRRPDELQVADRAAELVSRGFRVLQGQPSKTGKARRILPGDRGKFIVELAGTSERVGRVGAELPERRAHRHHLQVDAEAVEHLQSVLRRVAEILPG